MKISDMCLALGLAMTMASVSLADEPIAKAEDSKPKREFSEKQLAQQQRMKDCSAESKEKALKGTDRKAFMKTCLSGGKVTTEPGSEAVSAPTEKQAAQKEKMKTCNADAKSKALNGQERKDFMSGCLKAE